MQVKQTRKNEILIPKLQKHLILNTLFGGNSFMMLVVGGFFFEPECCENNELGLTKTNWATEKKRISKSNKKKRTLKSAFGSGFMKTTRDFVLR